MHNVPPPAAASLDGATREGWSGPDVENKACRDDLKEIHGDA